MEARIRGLERLDLEGLRDEWRRLWGPPPRLRSIELLRALIAWRLQAEAIGGLTAADRRRLESSSQRPTMNLPVGSRLVREWRGVSHETEAVEGGFRYQGRVYRSLSEVARLITGAQWNGPRFFGLRP